MKGGTMKALHRKYPEPKVETKNSDVSLYELIEAVSDSVDPGEEAMVPFIVSHILSSCNATLATP